MVLQKDGGAREGGYEVEMCRLSFPRTKEPNSTQAAVFLALSFLSLALHSSDQLGTHYADQAGFELIKSHLLLPTDFYFNSTSEAWMVFHQLQPTLLITHRLAGVPQRRSSEFAWLRVSGARSER